MFVNCVNIAWIGFSDASKSQARSRHSKQLMAQKTAAGRHPSHFREGVTKQPTPLPNVRDLQQQLSEEQQQHASELLQLEQRAQKDEASGLASSAIHKGGVPLRVCSLHQNHLQRSFFYSK